MNQSFVNGATLLGTAITLFVLGQSSIVVPLSWNYWVMHLGSIFFLITAVIEFLSFK